MKTLKNTTKQALIVFCMASQFIAAGCTSMQFVPLDERAELAAGDEVVLTFSSGYRLYMEIESIDGDRLIGSGANVPTKNIISIERKQYDKQKTSDRLGESLLVTALFPICAFIYTGGKFDCTS